MDRCVNDIISANHVVHSQELPLQSARSIEGLRTVDEVDHISGLLPGSLSLSDRLSVGLPAGVSGPGPSGVCGGAGVRPVGRSDGQTDVCGALLWNVRLFTCFYCKTCRKCWLSESRFVHSRCSDLLLCGRSHLLRTGDVQDLLIVSERQMAKGVSRMVAVTGREAAQVRME